MADLGLCHPDSNQDDASGALAAFSRVVGGVQFTITTQAWQDAQSAYEAREPYYDWAWGGRPAEVTTTKLLRPRANWSEGWLAGQMLVFEEDLQEMTDGWCRNDTSSLFDHQAEVLREMRIATLTYNHNHNTYAYLNFRFVLQYGGGVLSKFEVKPMQFVSAVTLLALSPGFDWSMAVGGFDVWLTLLTYVLVLTRTASELRAALKIKRAGRPLFFDYFGGIFTQLELFNIVCNFTIFGLKVYYAFDGTTSHFISMILPQASTADVAAQADALQGYATAAGVERSLRGLSILSACLLFFKYLELAPRRAFSSCYLMGTALSRAGTHIKYWAGCILGFVLAMSMVAETLFGTQLREFSSLYDAFFTLVVSLCGYGGTYWNLVRVEPVGGALFFVCYQTMCFALLTPLFLAFVNDAYAMRSAALEQIKERVRKAEEMKQRARQGT